MDFTSAMPGLAMPGLTMPAVLLFEGDEGTVGGAPPEGSATSGPPMATASVPRGNSATVLATRGPSGTAT